MCRAYSKRCKTVIMANSRYCQDTFLGLITLSSVRTDTLPTGLKNSCSRPIKDGTTVLAITLLQVYLTEKLHATMCFYSVVKRIARCCFVWTETCNAVLCDMQVLCLTVNCSCLWHFFMPVTTYKTLLDIVWNRCSLLRFLLIMCTAKRYNGYKIVFDNFYLLSVTLKIFFKPLLFRTFCVIP
jgi:hypothetical protein